MFAVLLALGLADPAGGAAIFHQDQVPEHAELAWYLNTVTPVNRLMRMTTWKVRFCSLSCTLCCSAMLRWVLDARSRSS